MRKNRCRLIKLLTKIQWIHFIVYSLDISMIFNQIEFWKILWHHDKIWSHMQLRIMANSSHIYVIIYSTFHIFNIANIPFGEDIEQNQTLQKKLYDVINKILEPYILILLTYPSLEDIEQNQTLQNKLYGFRILSYDVIAFYRILIFFTIFAKNNVSTIRCIIWK